MAPPADPRAPAAPHESTPTSALGRRVGAGAAWMLSATVAAKAAGLGAQAILGWLLVPAEFGVYATALGLVSFIAILRDGGVRDLLVRRAARAYRPLSGPVFWLALAANTAIAACLCAVAPLAGAWAAQPELPLLLVAAAAALPVGTPAMVLAAKLRAELRFSAAAKVSLAAALLGHIAVVVFALRGLGPLSFPLAALLAAAAEGGFAWLAARDAPWTRPARPRLWGRLLRRTRWLILGSAASMTHDRGPLLLLARLAGPVAAGLYFFAFQIALQVGVLVAQSAQHVLFPALSRLGAEPGRAAGAALRALRGLGVAVAPAGVGLAACIAPLEALVWRGRWAEAVPAAQILAILFVIKSSSGVTTAILLATGRERARFWLDLAEGAAGTAAAWYAAARWGHPAAIALAYAGVMAAARTAIVLHVVRRLGAPAGATLDALSRPLIACLPAGAAALAVDAALGPAHPALARLALAAALVGALAALGLRLFAAAALADLLAVAPPRLAGPTLKLLGLSPPRPRPA